MTTKDDGGRAFPSVAFWDANGELVSPGSPGMSLRDYTAIEALKGLCANPGGPFQANDISGWGLVNCKLSDVAGLAFDIADAMLEARRK